MVCRDCLTSEELGAIENDALETSEQLSSCARCGDPRLDDIADIDAPGGWRLVPEGIICPGCVTPEDRQRNIDEMQRAIDTLKGWPS
jgi:hypothetical protein